MSEASRVRALTEAGLVHPHPEAVIAPLFAGGGFFLALDKVQVKYEMLRSHLVDGISVTDAAANPGPRYYEGPCQMLLLVTESAC